MSLVDVSKWLDEGREVRTLALQSCEVGRLLDVSLLLGLLSDGLLLRFLVIGILSGLLSVGILFSLLEVRLLFGLLAVEFRYELLLGLKQIFVLASSGLLNLCLFLCRCG